MSLRRCGVPDFGLSDIHAGRADGDKALDMLRKAIFKAAPSAAGDLDAAVPAFLRELFEIRKSLTSVSPDECFLLFCQTFLESASEAKIAWVKQLLATMAPESATAPNSAKTAATTTTSDLKRFLRRSGVSVPPSEERLRSLALDACSTHLDSARDCSDPALALAAMALTVCPERARDEAVKGRELLLKAVSILTNFNSMLNVVPMALAQLTEPSELVSFTERLLRAGAKRKVSIVVGGKVSVQDQFKYHFLGLFWFFGTENYLKSV